MGEQQLPGSGKPVILQYNGLFDFDGVYAAITDWAKNYGFLWHESEYKHKATGKSAEVELKWTLTKDVTDYIKNEIIITVHVWDLQEVEVNENGKKHALSNARLFIWFEPKVITDWRNKFSGGKFSELLGKWYNRIMDRDTSNSFDELYYRTMNLHAIVKKYFDMQSKKHHYKGYLD